MWPQVPVGGQSWWPHGCQHHPSNGKFYPTPLWRAGWESKEGWGSCGYGQGTRAAGDTSDLGHLPPALTLPPPPRPSNCSFNAAPRHCPLHCHPETVPSPIEAGGN